MKPSAHDWNQRGLEAYQQANFEQAAECFEKAADDEPTSSVVQDNLGLALARIGQFVPALQCHLRAIQLDPDNATAHLNLATLIQDNGDLIVESEYETVLDLAPDHPEADSGLAKLYYDRGDYVRALSLFKKLIRRNVHDIDAYNHLGLCYASLADYAKARKYWLKAVSLDVNNYFAHLNLAALYATDYAFDRALTHLERSLSIDPRQGVDDLNDMPQFDELRQDPRCQRLMKAYPQSGVPLELVGEPELDPTPSW